MKIAIIGAAYTGLATAKYFKSQGHSISVTTTKEARKEELEEVADKVTVMFGSDKDKMKELLVDQEILVLTVAGGMVEKEGKTIMDPNLYRDAYVGTAESVVNAIDSDSSLRQIIFSSSLNAYGDGGGAQFHGSMIINKASSNSYTEIGEFRKSNTGGAVTVDATQSAVWKSVSQEDTGSDSVAYDSDVQVVLTYTPTGALSTAGQAWIKIDFMQGKNLASGDTW